ncbi:hypothetical protein [Parafrankia discariae]|uniref:hypothetical protein n=1 Tax=Parafrankia discariae TaxID=365528 RepID=UPI0038991E37
MTRVVGRSTLGELSTFQLLIYVTMGDLVRQAITQQDYSVTSGVLAVSVFAVLAIALSAANARWPAVRTVTHGIPVVVIGQGIVVVRISRATRWPPGDEPVPDEGRIPGISKARSR